MLAINETNIEIIVEVMIDAEGWIIPHRRFPVHSISFWLPGIKKLGKLIY